MRRERRTKAECVRRLAFDDPLVSDHCANVDVDADERCASRRTDRQRGAGVVPQSVDAEAQTKAAACFADDARHGGDRLGIDMLAERTIAEILEYDAVTAAGGERTRIVDCPFDDRIDRSAKKRRTRQRREVHHAEDGVATEAFREI